MRVLKVETVIRVVIAVEDALVRDILRSICTEPGMEVVAEALTLDEAASICVDLRPDVLVVSDRVGGEGVETRLAELTTTGAGVVVVSDDVSPERMMAALLNGAAGCLFRDATPDEVANGIVAVAAGASVLSPEVTRLVVEQWRRLRIQPTSLGGRVKSSLTARETEVLAAMTDGLSAKAIARRLDIAVKTVENHKVSIFQKLGVRTQSQAISTVVGYGLLGSACNGLATVNE